MELWFKSGKHGIKSIKGEKRGRKGCIDRKSDWVRGKMEEGENMGDERRRNRGR